MQRGKIYVKGNCWYFRYQEPVNVDGRKAWRDKYINLAPRDRFSSASAAEKECRQKINEALGKADAMTADTMTPSTISLGTSIFRTGKMTFTPPLWSAIETCTRII
jgi:hypothetical protein